LHVPTSFVLAQYRGREILLELENLDVH